MPVVMTSHHVHANKFVFSAASSYTYYLVPLRESADSQASAQLALIQKLKQPSG